MSLEHRNAFLADIKGINTSFTQKRSSLKGLLEYLDAHKLQPSPFASLDNALARCEKPQDARLTKYRPAILNLVAVWGTAHPYEVKFESASKETNYGVAANCYAYALGCRSPVNGANGGAWPGAAANAAVKLLANADNLIAAVTADGATRVLGNLGAPPNAAGGNYLVAALSNAAGFHFLRRNSVSGYWSWKDGNGGTVKLNIYDLDKGCYVRIDNSSLNELLATRKARFSWLYQNMSFAAFFAIPDGGLTVAGRPPQGG